MSALILMQCDVLNILYFQTTFIDGPFFSSVIWKLSFSSNWWENQPSFQVWQQVPDFGMKPGRHLKSQNQAFPTQRLKHKMPLLQKLLYHANYSCLYMYITNQNLVYHILVRLKSDFLIVLPQAILYPKSQIMILNLDRDGSEFSLHTCTSHQQVNKNTQCIGLR